MKISQLEFEGEPAQLVYGDDGSLTAARVWRGGQWVDANWADLFFKAKKAPARPQGHDAALKQVNAAGVLFTTPEGKALFLKRGKGDFQGHWALPGGGIEKGETPIAAVARDSGEEIGYWPRHPGKFEHIHTASNGYKTFHYPLDREFTPKLNEEHTEHAWLDPRYPPQPLHPGVRELLGREQAHDAGPPDEPRDEKGEWTSSGGFTAYHGSGHAFPKFSSAKIGSGQGAQSYGYGLYLARNPQVAKTYQDQLGGANKLTYAQIIKALGKRFYLPQVSHADWDRLASAIQRGETPEDAALHLQWQNPALRDPGPENGPPGYVRKGLIKAAQAMAAVPKGNLYTVKVKADPDAFLDWDRPLEQQPDEVKRALAARHAQREANASPDHQERAVLPDWLAKYRAGTLRLSGEQVYHGAGLGTPESATKWLAQAGIPGIKYLDEGSREQGGTHNYVVFDPRILEITHRNGEPVTPDEAHDIALDWALDYDPSGQRLPAGGEGGGEWTSGGGEAYLRTAIKVGQRMYLGDQGESHQDVAARNKVNMFGDPTQPGYGDNRGFVDHQGRFYKFQDRAAMNAALNYAAEHGLMSSEGRLAAGGAGELVSEYLEPRSFAEGEEFVSPSTETGMTLPKAVSALQGPAQKDGSTLSASQNNAGAGERGARLQQADANVRRSNRGAQELPIERRAEDDRAARPRCRGRAGDRRQRQRASGGGGGAQESWRSTPCSWICAGR